MLALKNTSANNLTVFGHETRLMGSNFEISVVGENHAVANQRINSAIAEINRVEKLLTTFGEDSEINLINRNAGMQPVKVSGEIFRLIERSLKIAELTYGTFDITYYSADKIFIDSNNSAPLATIPYSVTKTNYQAVVVDPYACTVFLKEKGMRISLAAIAKGYAADRAKYLLQMEGVSSGVITFDGDILTWGIQPDLEPWTAATALSGFNNQQLANLDISNMALATAVNKQKPAKVNNGGGFMVSAIENIYVLSPSAEFSSALTSPLMAMGINAGLYLMNKLNQVSCVITDDQNRVYTSKGIKTA
ncbi:FAD:protein FMN transferase [Mucilaginibacter auburnensis]|uniref:FAD:protein FMN transferase n=1 Tax=Mucilaginibacter auburnensis TaxID=1457233 RepID=A0A2H9VPS4_9SPHI|nr:FAD:protein FMN transferase [Mucilaginibacter auburnensis]PJJ80316.1 thiamine biosynthesis lipoprotein [Mucilaginibacter auburnensis]